MAALERMFTAWGLREQALIAVSIAVVVTALIYLGAWRPLANSTHALREANTSTATTLATVTELAAQYRQLKAADVAHEARQISLSQIINAEVAAFGLRMARFQPDNQRDVEVRFDGMPFNDVLRWLHRLEAEHGIAIRDLSVTAAGDPGLVNISVRLYQH